MSHIEFTVEQVQRVAEGEITITAQDVREGLWRDARRLAGLGLVAELASWGALLASAPGNLLMVLAGLCIASAAVATFLAVARGAVAWDMHRAFKNALTVLALLPVLRLIPMVALSGRHPPTATDWPDEWQPSAATAARQRSQERQDRRAQRRQCASRFGTVDSAHSSLMPDSRNSTGFGSTDGSNVDTAGGTEGGISAILWPAAADTVRQQALQRLSSAVPRIRMIDTEGLPDGALLPPERLMRDLNLPFDVDLSRLELPLTRATKGVFGVQYMVDDGNRYTPVVQSDLTEAGLSVNDLHRLALDNLRRLVKGELKLKRANPKNPGNNALRIKLDGYHETSALLLDDLWDKALKKHTPNGVVAVMPSRDVCTFIDLSALTKGGLADLKEAMLQAKRMNGEVINAILHRQGRGWALAGQLDGV